MLIPGKGWHLKRAVFLWALIAVPWMIVEGSLGLTVFLGLLTSLLILFALTQKYLAGRVLSTAKGLLTMTTLGLLLGLGTALMALTLAAIKTGLHAHGPEFSNREIAWLIGQIPLWAVSGIFVGLGSGLLVRSFSQS